MNIHDIVNHASAPITGGWPAGNQMRRDFETWPRSPYQYYWKKELAWFRPVVQQDNRGRYRVLTWRAIWSLKISALIIRLKQHHKQEFPHANYRTKRRIRID